MKKFIKLFLFTILLSVCVAGLNGIEAQGAAKVKISSKKVTIRAGKTKRLKVIGLKKGTKKKPKKKVKWSSSNKKILTVDGNGKIRAIKIGSATVTAKVGKKKYTSKITVAAPTYTIESTSKPYDIGYTNWNGYNSKTRLYFTLYSYMTALERAGGGTLIFKKGTYKITNTIFVPSNVKIVLNDGVIIKKCTDTDTPYLDGNGACVFELIGPGKHYISEAVGKYGGAKNIKLIGKGNAVVDLNKSFGSSGVILCHNQNITIDNIIFKNGYGAHPIELDASLNVLIKNCEFIGHKDSVNNNKEAINIDVPDKATGGINVKWAKMDKTGNRDIFILNNTFRDLETAIGGHQYTEGTYHRNVQIIGNKIDKTDKEAIRFMNWADYIIKNNIISNVDQSRKYNSSGIFIAGGVNGAVVKNTFTNMPKAIQIATWKISVYPPIYTNITELEKQNFLTNICDKVDNTVIQHNLIFKNYKSKDSLFYSMEEEK